MWFFNPRGLQPCKQRKGPGKMLPQWKRDAQKQPSMLTPWAWLSASGTLWIYFYSLRHWSVVFCYSSPADKYRHLGSFTGREQNTLGVVIGKIVMGRRACFAMSMLTGLPFIWPWSQSRYLFSLQEFLCSFEASKLYSWDTGCPICFSPPCLIERILSFADPEVPQHIHP